ncbi:DUF4145 domain-containing protein [Phototrophicus methaneseepsis]|uniref:DUF4145 domain-containing protein n=1 Tax=Phototrophicus methaneseepsis TaxID=2710758 RepID=A0A7S8E6Y4_9CHLR|nr:DUF4145 domain-containing protein [Phototrophicus methaneseepsis]QPC81505.1 DUF4145 domain-containing protein [Phototrophicus methaneseepsis]
MPLPESLDALIRNRFANIEENAKLLEEVNDSGWALAKHYAIRFHQVKANVISLLMLMKLPRTNRLVDDLRHLADEGNIPESAVYKLLGIISAIKSDYEDGILDDIAERIEAEIAGDYLTQATSLLSEGDNGNFDHIPAAVLTGAILEDSLRRLCQRQDPPIEIMKSNGKGYKTLGTYIDDLKNAGLYNELTAKHLRAWADIRNKAAHGQFDEFGRNEVELMLQGVQNFLADYL